MQITFFGAFWIIILIFAALRGTGPLAKCIIFSGIVQSGAIVIIGKSVVPPLLFSCIFFDLYCILLYGVKYKIAAYIKILSVFLAAVTITSILSGILFKGNIFLVAADDLETKTYSGEIEVIALFRLFIYIITAIIFYNVKSRININIDSLIETMVITVFIIGIWQYATLINLFPKIEFLTKFVYSAIDVNKTIFYGNDILKRFNSILNIRLYSCFMEPSYCAGFLTPCIIYYFMKEKLSKRDIIVLLLLFIMLVVTRSTTGYVSCVICVFISLFFNGKKAMVVSFIKRGAVLLILGIIFVSAFDLWGIVYTVVFEKTDSHSGIVRSAWNKNCLEIFWQTYCIGLGYGINRGSSFFFTLIGSTGIAGTLVYCYFVYNILYNAHCSKSTNHKFVQVSMMFLSVIVSMFIAIGVLEYTVFYSFLFLYSYTAYNSEEHNLKKYSNNFIYERGQPQ